MKKRSIVLLSVLVLIVGLFSIFAVMSGATTPSPEISIPYCNLSFRDSVCIKYAVKSNVSDVKILIWTAPEKEYTVGTQDSEIAEYYEEDIDGVMHKIFDYTELAAKQMTDVVYARAYAKVGGADYYSEVNKYSILQYAYNMLGKTAPASEDTELKEMLALMLEYGAAAQKYLDDYKVDRLATADWYQVKLTAGALDDGCTHGLYLPGDKVTMTAPETDANGATFAYWADGKGNKVGATATYELTVGNTNSTYTPVYIKYSSGLEFDSNGDGTCYVIGKGECMDADLVIPPMSPDNDSVIGIESSAFAGEAITSVSFPSTIEEIGRRAFNNCTSLTDVYFDGTEEEWNNISISTGNDPIENATKHFNEPVIETFTVTFVDYDGTELKTETVKCGKSATAPENPTREGYSFTGWDKDFSNVTSDMTVTAVYEENYTEPTFVVSNATAKAGDSDVEITIALKNNPGITSILMNIAFDEAALDLVSMTYNAEIGGTAIPNESNESPITVYWADNFKDITDDFVFVTLKFNVSNTAASGDYDITLTYNADDVYNANETNVDFKIVNGTITIS